MLEQPEGDSQFDSEDISCEYCACDDPRCLVRCKEDGRWFCNNRTKNGCSHIIYHLVKARAKTIELPASNQYSKIPLSCAYCQMENIFELCLAATLNSEADYCVVCKSCLNRPDVSPLFDRGNTHMLVTENNCIATWLVEQLPAAQLRQYLVATKDDIDLLEEQWKVGKTASMRDIPEIKQKLTLPDTPGAFETELEYYQTFTKFVERERQYEEAKMSESLMRHILVQFDVSGPITHVRFQHPLPESCPSWCVGADVTVKGGDYLEDAIVEQIGFDNRVILRIKRSGWQPPKSEEYCDMKVVFNEIPFTRQVKALERFVKHRAASSDIRQVLLGDIDAACEWDLLSATCERSIPGSKLKQLNPSQFDAVQHALNYNFTLIQGPPGTGKTTTIASYVYNRAQQHDGKILVCGPSNVVVEHLTQYIARTGVKVVRLMGRQFDDVHSNTEHCNVNKLMYKLGTSSSMRLRQLQEKRVKEGLSSREEHEYDELRERVELDILRHADVVCCTTVTAGSKVLEQITFPYVVVDEATQGVEPEILIPLCHGCQQLVLVGDHKQLGPSVSSPQALKAGYGRSVVERLVELGMKPRILTVQYRMHPAIAEFPSNYFYDGMLQNGCSIADRSESRLAVFPWPKMDIPMFFLNSHDGGSEERQGSSYLNRYECMLVGEIVSLLYGSGVQPQRIGIITPYAAQRSMLQDYLWSYGRVPEKYSAQIPVASVDAFQGAERDYIIMSCVRSSNAGRGTIGFLKEQKRLNVALTRGRMGLMIIGSVPTLATNRMWSDLIKHFQSKSLLVEGTIEDMRPSGFVNSGPCESSPDSDLRSEPYYPDDGYLE